MPGIQNSKSTLDFLGALGANRGDFVIAKSAEGLVKLAGFLIEKASDNLERKGHVASGGTISSMKIVNLDLSGTKLSLDVQILSTYKFLDKGVKGYESGSGKYQFKKPSWGKKKGGNKSGKPPRMVVEILKWLRRRAAKGKIKYTPVSVKEKKDVSINRTINQADNLKRLAYATATNIKKKGIRPTFFFTNAVKDTQKQAKKILGQALKLDIIQNLKLN